MGDLRRGVVTVWCVFPGLRARDLRLVVCSFGVVVCLWRDENWCWSGILRAFRTFGRY